jgi:hypothetical protein
MSQTTITKLKEKWSRENISYSQRHRNDFAAIYYLENSKTKMKIGYEIFYVFSESRSREVYPNSDDFGITAWSCYTPEMAAERYFMLNKTQFDILSRRREILKQDAAKEKIEKKIDQYQSLFKRFNPYETRTKIYLKKDEAFLVKKNRLPGEPVSEGDFPFDIFFNGLKISILIK